MALIIKYSVISNVYHSSTYDGYSCATEVLSGLSEEDVTYLCEVAKEAKEANETKFKAYKNYMYSPIFCSSDRKQKIKTNNEAIEKISKNTDELLERIVGDKLSVNRIFAPKHSSTGKEYKQLTYRDIMNIWYKLVCIIPAVDIQSFK